MVIIYLINIILLASYLLFNFITSCYTIFNNIMFTFNVIILSLSFIVLLAYTRIENHVHLYISWLQFGHLLFNALHIIISLANECTFTVTDYMNFSDALISLYTLVVVITILTLTYLLLLLILKIYTLCKYNRYRYNRVYIDMNDSLI